MSGTVLRGVPFEQESIGAWEEILTDYKKEKSQMKTINKYHFRFLVGFAIVCLGHWMEHVFQTYQVWVMHMPRSMAGGCLGMAYPWLVQTEILHYGYALVMLIGLWVLREGFHGRAYTWWMIAFWIQVWHHFEHLLLISQATFHQYLFGRHVPTSILQLFYPRIELHLFYNTLVTIPMVVAMVLYMKARNRNSTQHTIYRQAEDSHGFVTP